MGAHFLSPCIRTGLWTGFQGVHGKENALPLFMHWVWCPAMSRARLTMRSHGQQEKETQADSN